jgi:WD40 repeat protein
MSETLYDLFVSYVEADHAWVEGYLLDALTHADLRCYTEADFPLGVPRLEALEDAVKASRHILLIVSPAYLAEDLARFTDLMAQHHGLETATWPVIPLILEEVQLPPRLATLPALDASDPARQAEVIGELCAKLQRPVPAPLPRPPCPYPGMVPFSEEDSDRFFGRDQQVEALLQQLRLHPFLTVIGPSGSGKSSLVYAGLIPALRKSGLFGPAEWLVRAMRPGESPLATLRATIGDAVDLETFQPTGGEGQAPHRLLVVDQFEETFTHAKGDGDVLQKAVLRLSQAPTCYVVLTVRADFYPDLMAGPLWPEIQAHRAEVLPLGEEGLRQAIVSPAERMGVFVETALVERLIDDAAGEPGILPFVQETLVLLWERVERRYLPLRAYEGLVLTASSYEDLGDVQLTGLQVAMAQQAEATLAGLSADQQTVARRIFLRLVQFGQGRTDIRRQQTVSELCCVEDSRPVFDQILRHLTDHRLLTLGGGEQDGDRTVDIAHEALIDGWPTLRHWLGERREAEQIRRRLEAKAQEWVRLGRGSGGLMDEVELLEAERWLASADAADLGYGPDLPALVAQSRQAIEASAREKEAAHQRELELMRKEAEAQQERARTQARATKRLIWLAGSLFVVFLVAMAAAVFAGVQRRAADKNAATAVAAQGTAEAGATVLAGEVEQRSTAQARAQRAATAEANALVTSEASLARAVQAQETAEAERARAEVQQRNAERQAQIALSRQVAAVARTRLDQGYAQQALLLGIAAAKQITETVEAANILRDALHAWHGEAVLTGHEERVSLVAISLNGQYLASISGDDTARLWQLIGDRRVVVLRGHGDDLTDVEFSHDSRLVLTGSRDGTTRIWDAASGQLLHVLDQGGPVIAVAISEDDRLAATGSEGNNQVRLWDVERGEPVFPEVLQTGGGVVDVAFSPDGVFVGAASADTLAWLWHLPTGATARLTGYHAAVSGLSFSADGRYFATRSGKEIVVWALDTLQRVSLKQATHPAEVQYMLISPDGNFLATASGDARARLWDLRKPDADPLVLYGHEETISGLIFSLDSRYLATTSWDDTARLWRTDGGSPVATLIGHEAHLWQPAFSPDSSLLATPDELGTIRLWRVEAGGYLARHATGSAPATALTVLGKRVATAGEDGQVEIWDPATDRARAFRVGTSRLEAIGGDEAGGRLAVGDVEGQIAIVDAATGEVEAAWTAHANGVRDVMFLGEGHYLASAGGDAQIRLWDAGSGRAVRALVGHENDVNGLAPGPTASTLLSASGDGTVRLWNWQTGEQEGSFDAGEPLLAVALSPDGRTVAAGGSGSAIRLWDLADPAARPVLLPHETTVHALAFGPGGTVLADGDERGTVRLWNLGRQEAEIIPAHSGYRAWDVAFGPGGNTLFSVGGDGQVRSWPVGMADVIDLACHRAGRNLTEAEWQEFLSFLPYAELCPGVKAKSWTESERLDPVRPTPALDRAAGDQPPTIYYFEAVPGCSVRRGERVTLRWNLAGATAAYLVYGGTSHGITAPNEQTFAPTEDTIYRLLTLDAGEGITLTRSLSLTITVREE